MRVQIVLLTAAMAAGCSSVDVISAAPPIQGRCDVTVYQTRAQALKHGAIEELCIINGTSSGSFSHTIATAIEKHKSEACACGATNVYVGSRQETGWQPASVSMVAFRYVTPSPAR